jgi:hypothetical protein
MINDVKGDAFVMFNVTYGNNVYDLIYDERGVLRPDRGTAPALIDAMSEDHHQGELWTAQADEVFRLLEVSAKCALLVQDDITTGRA